MKTFKWYHTIILSTSIFFLAGCGLSSGNTESFNEERESLTTSEAQNIQSDSVNCPALLSSLPKEELSDGEKKDLIFMREEEKLARDVYLILYEKWNLMPFKNISKSEQVHMNAILSLLRRYELEDPSAGKEVGAFENEELQNLYNDLLKKGSINAVEALKVGALIEEVDIEDLQRMLDEGVDNRDIALVYGNLLRGSSHHLKAFIWNLKRRNVDYSPQVLDLEVYDKILND